MPRIIAIANNKGGVGKTTTTQALGTVLAQQGRSVLLLDLESQHSLTDLYKLNGHTSTMYDVLGAGGHPGTADIQDITISTHLDNLYLAPAQADLVLSEESLGSMDMPASMLDLAFRRASLPYDYVLIDTSPSLGLLLLNALVAADEVIVPIQPEPMAVRGFRGIYSFIRRARTVQEYGQNLRLYLRAVVVTFFRHGHVVDEETLLTLRQLRHPDYPDKYMPVAPMVVPETTLFRQATVVNQKTGRGQTIFDIAPDHPGAEAYRQLAVMVNG